MAGSVNKVILMGNLTRDVGLGYTKANQAVANFGLAMNRRYTTGDGEKREEVTFVECEVWGKTAETMAKYLSKGRPVYVEGRLKLDEWQDKDTGQKRSKLLVVVESFQFVDSRVDRSEGDAPADDAPDWKPANPKAPPVGAVRSAMSAPVDDDEIPF